MIVYGTQSPEYQRYRNDGRKGKNNGAYFYPKEIEELILPKLKDYNVLICTAGAPLINSRHMPDGSIIVCHDNKTPLGSYRKFLGRGITWVCSKPTTVKKFKDAGERAVFVPLSIDVAYVKKFKTRKTLDTAYAGNIWHFKKKFINELHPDIDVLSGMSRETLLKEMAKYKHVISEGRCQMEALALGCTVETPVYTDKSAALTYNKPIDTKDVLKDWDNVLRTVAKEQSQSCIIRAIREFNDLEEHKTRRKGDVFRVSKERAEELLSNEHNIVEEL